DLTTRIFYLEKNWAGLTYRTNGTAVFSIGFAANNMHISYSYDHTFAGEIMPHTLGTHEIGISFRIQTLATQRHIGFWEY
ncbi:MAG: type IX secretion system membrane protein PorP/SprF, partial [Flavobacteriales bacterium]|nr:type IX secretion system membrane protein PorP/SprF [Flavobacteriales bacterium]